VLGFRLPGTVHPHFYQQCRERIRSRAARGAGRGSGVCRPARDAMRSLWQSALGGVIAEMKVSQARGEGHESKLLNFKGR